MKMLEKMRGTLVEAIALLSMLDSERIQVAEAWFAEATENRGRGYGEVDGNVLVNAHRLAGKLDIREDLQPMLEDALQDLDAFAVAEELAEPLTKLAERDRDIARAECESELHQHETGDLRVLIVGDGVDSETMSVVHIPFNATHCSITPVTDAAHVRLGELMAKGVGDPPAMRIHDDFVDVELRPETVARTADGVSVTCVVITDDNRDAAIAKRWNEVEPVRTFVGWFVSVGVSPEHFTSPGQVFTACRSAFSLNSGDILKTVEAWDAGKRDWHIKQFIDKNPVLMASERVVMPAGREEPSSPKDAGQPLVTASVGGSDIICAFEAGGTQGCIQPVDEEGAGILRAQSLVDPAMNIPLTMLSDGKSILLTTRTVREVQGHDWAITASGGITEAS